VTAIIFRDQRTIKNRDRAQATVFLGAMVFYGWNQFIKPKEEKASRSEITELELPPETVKTTVTRGTAGWIYVGSQINDQWQKSQADGIEPALTLDVQNLPVRGKTYKVIQGVNLRDAAPIQRNDKSRPPMSNSKGTIGIGSIVKVDDIAEVEIDEPELRTWIWAHVTVVEAR